MKTVSVRLTNSLYEAVDDRRRKTGTTLQWLIENYLSWYSETGRTPWTEGVGEGSEPLQKLLDADPQALAALMYLADKLACHDPKESQGPMPHPNGVLIALRQGRSL